MIAELTGTVRAIGPDGAIVAVGGVGLQVSCTPATLGRLRVGETATVATALVVREDSLTLYGFADADERSVFDVLQTATGVGPRLAQAVLGVLDPRQVRAAVAAEDLTTLTSVPGVGRKLAQRLVLELRDRLGPPDGVGPGAGGAAVGRPSGPQAEVREGLLALGYSLREADEALAAVSAGTATASHSGQAEAVGPAVVRRSAVGSAAPIVPGAAKRRLVAAGGGAVPATGGSPEGDEDPAALLKAALGVLRRR